MNLNLSDIKNVLDVRRTRSSYYGQVPSVCFFVFLDNKVISQLLNC